MIDGAFYSFVKSLTANVYYGSANSVPAPYFVMYKITDDERPLSLCEAQGDEGKALFFIEGFKGGQGNASNPLNSLMYVETLKRQIAQKLGIITDGIEEYRVWHNKTTGVVPIDRGKNEVSFFGAQFTVLLYWTKII